jgi:hypothetical protein
VDTYDADARPGDIVLGHDGHEWGIAAIDREPRLGVTLVRHGERITGYPPPGTPVTIVQRAAVPADGSAEAAAMAALLGAGLMPRLVRETWEER